MPNLTSSDLQALGTLQTKWVEWIGGMVGAENVRLVTVLFIALLGISFIGAILKTVKNTVTALLLAIGITVVAGSLGVTQYTQLSTERVQQVLDNSKGLVDQVKSGLK